MNKFPVQYEISTADRNFLCKKLVFSLAVRCPLVLLGSGLVFLLWGSLLPAHEPKKDAPAPVVKHVDQLDDPLPAAAMLRLGTARLRYSPVWVVWSPDGKAILMGGSDNDALLWDTKTGKLLQRFQGHTWVVSCAVFVSGGKRVITLGDDSIRCWDIETGNEIWRYEEKDKMWRELLLTSDEKTLICACPEVYCWDVETGKRSQKIPALPGNVTAWYGAALTRDAKLLALSDREQIQLWNLDTEKLVAKIKMEKFECLLGFTPDGKMLVCLNEDGLVCREAASGKKIKSMKLPTPFESIVTFSPDGKQMAYRSEKRTLVLCEFTSGKEIRRFEAADRDRISAMTFSPDGKTLAAGGENSIYLWEVATGKDIRPAAVKKHHERSDAILSEDGKLVANAIVTRDALGIGINRAIEVWDVPLGKYLHTLRIPGNADEQFTTEFEFARDGKHFSATRPDGLILTWETASGARAEKRKADGPRPRKATPAVTYPDRKGRENVAIFAAGHLGAATFNEDEQGKELTLVLFSITDGQELRTLDWKRERFGSLIFSPDGRTLAGGGSIDTHDIFLWDVATGRLRAVLQGHIGEVTHLAFSRDSTTLVSTSADTTTLVWDLKRCGREGATPPVKLNERAAKALYKDLASDDAKTAYRAVWGLAAAPHEALPWLRQQLTPVPVVGAKQVQHWLSDLGHDDFATRETASKELARYDEGVEADLKKLLDAPPSPEAGRRAKELLDRLTSERFSPSAERRQQLRAVEALERMNTQEARHLLAKLAKGQRAAWLTRDAQAALSRLGKE